MKLKLQFIRLADWFDVHILRHNFPRICWLIGDSEWWDVPPEPPVTVEYQPEYDELKVRVSECPTEVGHNINGVLIYYDANRNLIGIDIPKLSTYVPEEDDIPTNSSTPSNQPK